MWQILRKQRKEKEADLGVQVFFSTTLGTQKGKQEDHKVGYLL